MCRVSCSRSTWLQHLFARPHSMEGAGLPGRGAGPRQRDSGVLEFTDVLSGLTLLAPNSPMPAQAPSLPLAGTPPRPHCLRGAPSSSPNARKTFAARHHKPPIQTRGAAGIAEIVPKWFSKGVG